MKQYTYKITIKKLRATQRYTKTLGERESEWERDVSVFVCVAVIL